jgi:hypothetical protein
VSLFTVTTSVVSLVLWVVMVGVGVFAFADALRRPTQAYAYVGKRPKNFWLLVTGIAAGAQFVLASPTNFLALIALVASFVYLFGVRPELQQYGGGQGGGSGGGGPYGSW